MFVRSSVIYICQHSRDHHIVFPVAVVSSVLQQIRNQYKENNEFHELMVTKHFIVISKGDHQFYSLLFAFNHDFVFFPIVLKVCRLVSNIKFWPNIARILMDISTASFILTKTGVTPWYLYLIWRSEKLYKRSFCMLFSEIMVLHYSL